MSNFYCEETKMDRCFGGKTWEEAAASLTGNEVIIVPLGAFEQHGPHLPLDTDTRTASKLGELAVQAAAEKGVQAYVTPTIWTGVSPYHMDFCGTITISAETLTALIVDVCRSLSKHGFSRIFLLNSHGGNVGAMRVAMQKLFYEYGGRVVSSSHWDFSVEFMREWRDSGLGGIIHACEMETSLMQYLYPEAVRDDKIKDHVWFPAGGYFSGDLTVGGKVITCFEQNEITKSGVMGAPSLASAEKGRELTNHLVEKISDFLVYYSKLDMKKMLGQEL